MPQECSQQPRPVEGTCLLALFRQIIRMQNAASSETQCISCMSGLNVNTNNTKPIRFILCSGEPFTAITSLETLSTTEFFRIEEILDNSCVLVRLLILTEGTFTCTTSTAVISLDCICSVQCFPPIFCPLCED